MKCGVVRGRVWFTYTVYTITSMLKFRDQTGPETKCVASISLLVSTICARSRSQDQDFGCNFDLESKISVSVGLEAKILVSDSWFEVFRVGLNLEVSFLVSSLSDWSSRYRDMTIYRVLRARRYASASTSYSLCLSVTSRSSIETDERIELVFAHQNWEVCSELPEIYLPWTFCVKMGSFHSLSKSAKYSIPICDSNRFDSLYESIRFVKKYRYFDSLVVMQFFLLI